MATGRNELSGGVIGLRIAHRTICVFRVHPRCIGVQVLL
jgi:hypothetical protein